MVEQSSFAGAGRLGHRARAGATVRSRCARTSSATLGSPMARSTSGRGQSAAAARNAGFQRDASNAGCSQPAGASRAASQP